MNYEEIFIKAKKDMNNITNSNYFDDVRLDLTLPNTMNSYAIADYDVVYINTYYLENSRKDKIYNTMCHELVHIYLENKLINNNSFSRDCSPLFCMICYWLNNNGFRVPQNYNTKSKFKNNIEFINIMKNKNWTTIDNFIDEFNKFINKDKTLYIQIEENIRKSYRNKQFKYGSGIIHLSNSDFKLSNYKNFIEQFK